MWSATTCRRFLFLRQSALRVHVRHPGRGSEIQSGDTALHSRVGRRPGRVKPPLVAARPARRTGEPGIAAHGRSPGRRATGRSSAGAGSARSPLVVAARAVYHESVFRTPTVPAAERQGLGGNSQNAGSPHTCDRQSASPPTPRAKSTGRWKRRKASLGRETHEEKTPSPTARSVQSYAHLGRNPFPGIGPDRSGTAAAACRVRNAAFRRAASGRGMGPG